MFRVLLAESDSDVVRRVCLAFSTAITCRVVAVESEAKLVTNALTMLKPDLLLHNAALGCWRGNRVIAYAIPGQISEVQLQRTLTQGARYAVWLKEDDLVALSVQCCAEPVGPSKAQIPRIMAIGAANTASLRRLLRAWPDAFPVPIIVAGCDPDDLEGSVGGMRVKRAEHKERVLPNTMYFAPGGMHVRVSSDEELLLNEAVPGDHAVDYLFRSVAEHYAGAAIGVLLSDVSGSDGLRAMSARGARTIVQDGSPSNSDVSLPLGEIAHYVFECAAKRGRT